MILAITLAVSVVARLFVRARLQGFSRVVHKQLEVVVERLVELSLRMGSLNNVELVVRVRDLIASRVDPHRPR